MKSHWEILVVDDEEVMRESLAAWLKEDGYRVDTAASGREAIEKSRAKDYAIYFVDLKMPGGIDGIETMMQIRKLRRDASIIIITAYATVDTAIAAMKEGAQEYIVKPCNLEEISLLVTRIIKVRTLQRENEMLKKRLRKTYSLNDIISKNPRMQEIFRLIHDIASLRSTVLIQGESGTGKELIARAIHSASDRADQPFVGVSCAALAETLLESELFGYEKGAFTGAVSQKKGKFEQAHGGTIFLDEIGDIASKLQLDLLRVLQERKLLPRRRVRRDSGGRPGHCRNERQLAGSGSRRAIPRRSFLPAECHQYPNSAAARTSGRHPATGPAFHRAAECRGWKGRGGHLGRCLAPLMTHSWPGNVRELENTLERALVTSRSRLLTRADFSFLASQLECQDPWSLPAVTLQELEKQAIESAIKGRGGTSKRPRPSWVSNARRSTTRSRSTRL